MGYTLGYTLIWNYYTSIKIKKQDKSPYFRGVWNDKELC